MQDCGASVDGGSGRWLRPRWGDGLAVKGSVRGGAGKSPAHPGAGTRWASELSTYRCGLNVLTIFVVVFVAFAALFPLLFVAAGVPRLRGIVAKFNMGFCWFFSPPSQNFILLALVGRS